MADQVLKQALAAVTEEKKKDNAESVEPKDFFWDQFVKYISSAILALTLLNITVEFFRDGGVSCFHPPDTVSLLPTDMDPLTVYEFARDQAAFINKYCEGSTPFTEFFPVYILVHGLLLISPHYIWSALYKGDFDSFFSIAAKIDRLRTSKTGEYSDESFNRVKKLEREYGGTNRKIFLSYVGKLFLQLMVCVLSVGLSAGWLRDFTASFDCPRKFDREDEFIPSEWPLNTTVPCVYNSLRILGIIRVVDFILTGLAAALIVYGMAWCTVRHTQQLGYRQMAKFAFQSCLKPEAYVFPPIIQLSGRPFLKRLQREYEMNVFSKYLLWLCTHRVHSIKLKNCFSPRIMNDLDFLLLTLFRADASHGKVFKNIQINKELQRLVGRDHQLLHLYINIQQDMMVNEARKNDASLRRRRRRSTQHTGQANGLEATDGRPPPSDEDGEEEKASGCFPGCLTKCLATICCCCFQKKKAEEDEKNGDEDIDGGDGSDDGERRMVADFRDIFTKSQFNGNPGNIAFAEKTAFRYFKPHLGNLDFQEENLSGMRDMIYWFVCKYGKSKPGPDGGSLSNNIAVDVSFGTIGYALVLSRAFKAVYSVNFHPYYRNTGRDVVKEEEFFTNYYILTYPDDIYTRGNHHIVQANQKILGHLVELERKGKSVDMIMVGPVSEEPLKVSINLFLNVINLKKCIGEGALLLAARPLRIGAEKVSSYKYEPSKKLFRKIKCEKLTLEQQKQICRYVDGQKGYKVVCGGVSCIFEFEAYEFCGHDPDSSDDDVAYGERSAEPEMAIGDSTPGRDWEDFDDSGAGHVQIVRGTDVVRTVAVDMEPSRSPEELETSSHSSRPLSGHVEALAYQQRSISGDNTSNTGSAGHTEDAVTRLDSMSVYSTPPNEIAQAAGSEPSERFAGSSGRGNPLNLAPVVNGFDSGGLSGQSVNSLHLSITSDMFVPNNAHHTSDRTSQNGELTLGGLNADDRLSEREFQGSCDGDHHMFRGSRASGETFGGSRTSVGPDKNAATLQPPLEEPDNSYQSTAV